MVERVKLKDLQFERFLIENKPVLIEEMGISSWPLMDYFLQTDSRFLPSKFLEECGEEVIPVHARGGIEEMKIKDFVSRLLLGECLYAKDWHMFHYCGAETLYSVPTPFIDDWLNWYWNRCQNNCDDYRFVYIGGLNSFTGVHHDVLCSYSWSVNLYGRKKWTLWSPNNVPHLSFHSNKTSLISDAREGHYDHLLYPHLADSSPLILYQDVNEAVFIPSGWYHMVENLDGPATISLNHNWFNGYTLLFQWDYLLNQFSLVAKEISDYHPLTLSPHSSTSFSSSSNTPKMSLSEWYHHSQYLLRIQTGIDFIQYLSLIAIRIFVLSKISTRKQKNGTQRDQLIGILCSYLYHNQREVKDEDPERGIEDFLNQCCSFTELDRRVYHHLCAHIFSPVKDNESEGLEGYLAYLTASSSPLSNPISQIQDRKSRIQQYSEIMNQMNSSCEIWNGWRYTLFQAKSVILDILNDSVHQIIDIISVQLQLDVALTVGLLKDYVDWIESLC